MNTIIRIIYSLLIVSGACSSLLAEPASTTIKPGTGPMPGFSTEAFADQRELIRDAYQRYEILTTRSGAEVRFELSDFVTILPDEYSEHAMVDIRTFGGGWTLRSVRRTRVDASRPDEGVNQYEPHWSQQPSWLEFSFPDLGDKSIETVFAEDPDFRPPEAITSYEVTVSFDERQRTYRAAFYFSSLDPLRFTIQDHVTQGVGYAYEDLPISGPDDVEPPAEDSTVSGIDVVFDQLGGKRCSSFLRNPNYAFQGRTAYNSVEHSTGRHSSAILFDFSCSCSSSCTSFCSPSTNPGCEDHGSLAVARVHVADTRVRDVSASNAGGDDAGAQCESTGVCAVESCTDQACNTVSIGIQGLLSVTVSGETVLENWDGHRHTCESCLLVDDGSSGEGGGGLTNDDGGDAGTRDPASPLVVDLDGRGFAFTSAEEGVLFDLDANGKARHFAWIMPGGLDAFLAIDLNNNGQIDSGYELFGDRSLQEPSSEPNGFKALAMYDRIDFGGNDDGRITRADADWEFLRLWLDENGDGVTDPGELQPLDAWNVEAVDLDYIEGRRRDPHGNLLRYHGRVHFQHPGGLPHVQVVDVFLQGADPSE